MSDRIYLTMTDNGRQIRADYAGGPYIELSFGTTAYAPTEVINVWDYAAGGVEDPRLLDPKTVRDAVKLQVRAWISANESDGWSDWYADYIRNARY